MGDCCLAPFQQLSDISWWEQVHISMRWWRYTIMKYIYIYIYHFYVACRGEPTNVDMCQFLSGLFFIRPIIILLLISNVIWTFSIIYIYKKCVSNSSVCSHIAQLSMTKPLLAHLRSIFRVKEILCTYKQVSTIKHHIAQFHI